VTLPGLAIVSQSMLVTPTELHRMVAAIAVQVAHDYAPAWSRLPVFPQAFAKLADVPRGMPCIRIVDSVDVADALGYHTETAGRITGVVGVQTILDQPSGSILEGSVSVSACLSHEVLETIGDPFCNVWLDGPSGFEYALEICDPVQDQVYEIGGVSVSDFILPAWCDVEREDVPCAFRARPLLPFARTEGGYIVVRDAAGEPKQLGERPPHKVRAHRAGWRRTR
jgi:hypothetical protein